MSQVIIQQSRNKSVYLVPVCQQTGFGSLRKDDMRNKHNKANMKTASGSQLWENILGYRVVHSGSFILESIATAKVYSKIISKIRKRKDCVKLQRAEDVS